MKAEDLCIGGLVAMLLGVLMATVLWSPAFNYMYDTERQAISVFIVPVGLIGLIWMIAGLALMHDK